MSSVRNTSSIHFRDSGNQINHLLEAQSTHVAPTCNKCIPLLSEVSISNEAKLDCYVASFIGGWDCKRTC